MFLSNSLYHTDVLLLQPLSGSDQTGYYKAALMIAEFVWFVPAAFQTMLLHSTTGLWAERNYEAISDVASRTSRYVLMLTLLLLAGLAILADSFIPLYYGASFVAATTPLLILLPGTLSYAIVKPIIAISEARGKLRYTLIATGGASVINIVLNVALIPQYGMLGAAVATSIGYSSMFVFNSWAAYKLGFDPFADLRLKRILASALGVVVVLFVLDQQIGSDLVSLVVIPPIGLGCYLLLLLRSGALDYAEITDIVSNAPAPIDRITSYIPTDS
jgi:O-antigen/teichoic acid export membrane protein